MSELTRRSILQTGCLFAVPPALASLISGCQQNTDSESSQSTSVNDGSTAAVNNPSLPDSGNAMKIHYLEIVTPDADALCTQYSTLHDLTFSEPNASLGGARTASLDGGSLIGIRKPMHDQERPVVRPYALVDDISASVDSAEKAGATVAVPPMEIPEHGQCAIVIHGGIECGFWQL